MVILGVKGCLKILLIWRRDSPGWLKERDSEPLIGEMLLGCCVGKEDMRCGIGGEVLGVWQW